jgi:hypothetical protein
MGSTIGGSAMRLTRRTDPLDLTRGSELDASILEKTRNFDRLRLTHTKSQQSGRPPKFINGRDLMQFANCFEGQSPKVSKHAAAFEEVKLKVE